MKCAVCGQEATTLTMNAQGAYVCAVCLALPKPAKHPVYNKKGFLVDDSILSMASYHAKLFPDGTYMFRIHDCNGGIRLRGDLNNEKEVKEAIEKLRVLEDALRSFRAHIERHYTIIEFA
jgi:hypothetical protein